MNKIGGYRSNGIKRYVDNDAFNSRGSDSRMRSNKLRITREGRARIEFYAWPFRVRNRSGIENAAYDSPAVAIADVIRTSRGIESRRLNAIVAVESLDRSMAMRRSMLGADRDD